LDPSQPAQTMTAYMVQVFGGDAPAFGVENLSCYAVAAVLFTLTLAMTMACNLLLRMFREEYD
ncbi:MAG: phosphate ABC transporter permease subunit PstC, partial [Planctomycetota bacterium]